MRESRFDAADNATAAAVRDRGDVLCGTPIEDGDDIVLRAGVGDEVGGVVEEAIEGADDIAERLAVRMAGAVFGVRTEEAAQRRGRGDARCLELDLLDPRRVAQNEFVEFIARRE